VKGEAKPGVFEVNRRIAARFTPIISSTALPQWQMPNPTLPSAVIPHSESRMM